MKRLALFLLLLACLIGTCPAAQATKGSTDTGFMSWVHDAWKTVEQQGKPAAEKLVRQWPKRFKSIKQQAIELCKRAHDKVAQLDLEQKKNLIVELWRMRKSLDLLTLVQPDVLQSLTGLDTSGLAALETQVSTTTETLQAQIDPKHSLKG